MGILGQQIIEKNSKDKAGDDPALFYEKLGKREVSILHDYLKLWTRSIEELLLKLKDTLPENGMIGEVHYWRDMARVLEAITDRFLNHL